MPPGFQTEKNWNKVIEVNADVVCTYEVFDFNVAWDAYQRLKEQGYRHFYFNIGPRTLGVGAGIFVASKYRVNTPQFTPYPQESLVGRTKNANKGIFSFNVESRSQNFARVFATHAQHSELPQFPTQEEIAARKMQMEIMAAQATKVEGLCAVLTGDFNLDEQEFATFPWRENYDRGQFPPEPSWGGDGFSARLVGKPASGPLNLDYTMVSKGKARITTTYIETGFDGEVFKEEALSDHKGLFSRIYPNKD
jgi:hypothetical protein